MDFVSGSIYISDLRKDVNEAILYNMFSRIGPLLSIHIRRDIMTRRSLGYAYVNFENHIHAELAIRKYNYKLLKGIPMRIMWSQRDPSIRKSGVGNVFIKNLHSSIDHFALHNLFAPFGYILSSKIVKNNEGTSLGYGFVHFEYQEDANRAIRDLNRMELKGKQIYVSPFLPREERIRQIIIENPYTHLYVKNFSSNTNERMFYDWFAKFGTITNFRLMRNADGSSRGFGFVTFLEPISAKRAVEELNGKEITPGKTLYVSKAQSREERRLDTLNRMKHMGQIRYVQFLDNNVFVKKLPDFVDEAKLAKQFGEFGTVESVRIAKDRGLKLGFGIVRLYSADSAYTAAIVLSERTELYRLKYSRLMYLSSLNMY